MNTICTVTTIKAPLHEAVSFVNYHLNYGIDRMFLYFDDPDDPAMELLQNHEQVTCTRCDDEYWSSISCSNQLSVIEKQKVNANHALTKARKMGFDWIAHIDSDELLFSQENIKEIIRQVEADALRFEINEAVPEKDFYPCIFNEKTLFRKYKTQRRKKLAQMLGCKKSFFAECYFRGHTASKTMVKVGADITCLGIHRPEMVTGPLLMENSRRIKLLHFDCCGYDAWKTKWSLRLDDKSDSWRKRSPARNMQFNCFRDAYFGPNRKDDLLEVYRRLYFIPPYEKFILRCLDMLTFIRIDRKLFQGPISLGTEE